MYTTAKFQKKICMPVNWGKMAHLPQPTTGTSFGNFIYTAIVCNEANLSLEANLSFEDMKQLLDRSHLHTSNLHTPKLIINPDLF